MTATLSPPTVTPAPVAAVRDDTRTALYIVAAICLAAIIALAGLAVGRWYGYAHGEAHGRTAALEECGRGVEQNRAVQAVVENAVRAPRGSHIAVCVVPD